MIRIRIIICPSPTNFLRFCRQIYVGFAYNAILLGEVRNIGTAHIIILMVPLHRVQALHHRLAESTAPNTQPQLLGSANYGHIRPYKANDLLM